MIVFRLTRESDKSRVELYRFYEGSLSQTKGSKELGNMELGETSEETLLALKGKKHFQQSKHILRQNTFL